MDPDQVRRIAQYRQMGFSLSEAVNKVKREIRGEHPMMAANDFVRDFMGMYGKVTLKDTSIDTSIRQALEAMEESPTTTKSSQPEAQENVMFGSNQLFTQVENATWDLLTGKVGYRDGQSVVTINEKRITRNPVIGNALPPLPAFALPTNAAQIAVGDLVINGETIIGFIVEKKESGNFSTIDFNGRIGEWSAPEGILFGDTKVVRSLTSMLGGETAGIQSMLMPFLLMGKDVSSILPILLMSKVGVPGTEVKGFDTSMLMTMMAMQSLGQGFRPQR